MDRIIAKHSAGIGFAVALLIPVAVLGCSDELQGPRPDLPSPSASASPPPVDPEIICRDQLTTEVTLHGEHLSPIPIDIPKHPRAALPTISLSRAHELDGGAVGSPDQVIYSGDPEKDSTNAADETAS